MLVVLEDDACFTFIPRSQDRENTATEEALFAPTDESERDGYAPTETVFPGQVTLSLKAGTAVPFDARGIHRGQKPPGKQRKSLFVVYGLEENVASCVICGWAADPVRSRAHDPLPIVLASLPFGSDVNV